MSRVPGPTQHDAFAERVPARTPGTLGSKDAADPDAYAEAGDIPGPLGVKGGASLGLGQRLAGPPSVGGLPVGVNEVVNAVTSSTTGRALFAKAKAANKNKDPVVKLGITEFGGFADTETGVITLDRRLDKCTAIDVLVQELTNLASAPNFAKVDAETEKGDVSRADYIKRTEEIEFRGLQNILKVFDETKAKTHCKTCSRDYQRQYGASFDQYFRYMSGDKYGKRHLEKIGARWDAGAKAAYEKKHPKR